MSKLLITIFIGALTLAGCDRASEPTAARDGEPVVDAFTRGQQAWRDERKASLTKPDGWTSLIGLHWIGQGAHYVGSDADNGIRLAMGPAHLGMLDRKDDRLRFVPDHATALTLNDEPLKQGVDLLSDEADTGPSKLAFDEGRGIATVIKRGDRYALRVKHADAPTRVGFKGIEYWPANTAWVVTGKFVPNTAGKTIPVANIIGTTDEMPNPGAVEFERDGRVFRLEALDEGGDELFLVFADRTSGRGSYPAGRFLYAPKPDAQGRVTLDFNKAYNPPCAFTAFATCPLPPAENRLDLAIDAGEKDYHFEEAAVP